MMTDKSLHQQYLDAARCLHQAGLYQVGLIVIPSDDEFVTFDRDAVLIAAHCNVTPRTINGHLTVYLQQKQIDQLRANDVAVHIVSGEN